MSLELEVRYMGLALEAGMFRPAVIRGYVEKIMDYIFAAALLIWYRQKSIRMLIAPLRFNSECLFWMHKAGIDLISRRAALKAWVLWRQTGGVSITFQCSCDEDFNCATMGAATLHNKLASTWWPQGSHWHPQN